MDAKNYKKGYKCPICKKAQFQKIEYYYPEREGKR